MEHTEHTEQDDPTRYAVLCAASELLVRDGLTGLTNRRIADRAGCSTMAIYSRFGSKGGILDALYQEGVNTLAAAQAEVDEGAPAVEQIVALCCVYRRTALDYSGHYQIMFGSIPGWRPDANLRVALYQTFERFIVACAKAVTAGVAEGPPEDLATALFSFCHGQVSLSLANYDPPGRDPEATYVDGVHRMLGTRGRAR